MVQEEDIGEGWHPLRYNGKERSQEDYNDKGEGEGAVARIWVGWAELEAFATRVQVAVTAPVGRDGSTDGQQRDVHVGLLLDAELEEVWDAAKRVS